jgi:hypothetical protein
MSGVRQRTARRWQARSTSLPSQPEAFDIVRRAGQYAMAEQDCVTSPGSTISEVECKAGQGSRVRLMTLINFIDGDLRIDCIAG